MQVGILKTGMHRWLEKECSSFSANETDQKPFFAVIKGKKKRIHGHDCSSKCLIKLWLTLSIHSIGAAGGKEPRTRKFSCI